MNQMNQMNQISKVLGRVVDGPHPAAKAIKTDLIDNILFTFNRVSILDYPWVSECSLFNPTPQREYCSRSCDFVSRSDDNRTYFLHRDYDLVIDNYGRIGKKYNYSSFSCANEIPSGYIHSHRRLFELDGTNNYENQASLKIIVELSQNFGDFSEEDIADLKMQTMSLITDHTSIEESDIRSLTVNRPFIEDRNRFKSRNFELSLHRTYEDWVMIESMKDQGYTLRSLPISHSYRDNSCTHIEMVFNPSFDKINELFTGISKWFVYSISSGSIIGKIDYNYQSNCEIACLGGDRETGTDYSRRYLEYRKNECIWGLLDCHCNSSGGVCLKVQNEGPNRGWYGFGLSGKVVNLGTSNTLEDRLDSYECPNSLFN